MSENIIKDIENKMVASLDSLKKHLSGIRTGRASASMVEPIKADAYGQNMEIKDLATVSVPEARLIKINVWDANLVTSVSAAIRNSNLELNPQEEGQFIRISIPELTAERRQEYAKICKGYAENGKVSIRSVRQESMNDLKKSLQKSEISEDEMRSISNRIQDLTDTFISKITDISNSKEIEILKI